MEVAAMAVTDFNFTPPRYKHYGTAPTTTKRSGEYYFSAPTSPKQLSQFYRDYDDFSPSSSIFSSIPFGWEERPGTPKSPNRNAGPEKEFAFDVGSSRSDRATIPAEELFDGGKIRQLKPPPGMGMIASPRSSLSTLWRKESDPFEKAVENTIRTDPVRGRERDSSVLSPASRRGIRSQSPYRVSRYPWEEEEGEGVEEEALQEASSSIQKNSISSKGSSRRWRLRDFFRSASEGDKDQARKYTRLFKKQEGEKHSSFRSVDSSSSGSGSKKKKESSSAHEYYKVNKAASEDLKKKSALPYKQGILRRLMFNRVFA